MILFPLLVGLAVADDKPRPEVWRDEDETDEVLAIQVPSGQVTVCFVAVCKLASLRRGIQLIVEWLAPLA